MINEHESPWWVRLNIDCEQYYGPFRTQRQAQTLAESEKCLTEVLQDRMIDGSYLELTGGEVQKASHYIVFRSGRIVPFSAKSLHEWATKEFFKVSATL